MEEVLELYKAPYDAASPLVCLDETSKQLNSETRVPLRRRPSRAGGRPGRVDRYDVVYKREGVRQLFLMFEPLRGWRHVVIRCQKSAMDWAEVIAELEDRLAIHDAGRPHQVAKARPHNQGIRGQEAKQRDVQGQPDKDNLTGY